MWSVSTILTGLYSFMLESSPTLGSVEATPAQRRRFAAQSLDFNCENETFRTLFPELVDYDPKALFLRECLLAFLRNQGGPQTSSTGKQGI